MRKLQTMSAAIALATAALALPAAAQDAGFYLGASVGGSKTGNSCNGMPAGISCDDKTNTWKLLGGYQFNRYVAAELGYSDRLAKVSSSGLGLTEDIKVSALELVAIPSYPIGDFSILGKLGVYAARTEDNTNFAGNVSESNSNVTFGAGVGYRFHRNFSARLEWQRYSKVGGGNLGKDDIDVLSIGALYHF
jgi:opacity protein-like surface antigen